MIKVQHLQPRKNLKSYGANSIQYKIIYIPWYKHTVGMLNPQAICSPSDCVMWPIAAFDYVHILQNITK